MAQYSRRVSVPGKSAEELHRVAQEHLARFLEKPNIQAFVGKTSVDTNDLERTLSLGSKLFKAVLRSEEGAYVLDAKLSLLALPFRSKIDEMLDTAIQNWILKAFGK